MIKVIDTKVKDSCYCQAYIKEHPDDRYIIVVSAKTDLPRYSSGKVKQTVEEMEKPQCRRPAEEYKIENLLKKNVSMIVNHMNFEDILFSQELLEELRDRNYSLILDGQFLQDRQITRINDKDFDVLTGFFNIKIGDDLSITWDETTSSDAYGDIMRKSNAHNLYLKDWNSHDFICRFPSYVFPYFKEVLVLVKDFDKSQTKRYLKKYGVDYELLTDPRRKRK